MSHSRWSSKCVISVEESADILDCAEEVSQPGWMYLLRAGLSSHHSTGMCMHVMSFCRYMQLRSADTHMSEVRPSRHVFLHALHLASVLFSVPSFPIIGRSVCSVEHSREVKIAGRFKVGTIIGTRNNASWTWMAEPESRVGVG